MRGEDALTTLVVPTMGRPSLRLLLEALVDESGALPAPLVVVDDRPPGHETEDLALPDVPDLHVVVSGGGGPARARNLGWRRARTPWVSFLDDDVVPEDGWYAELVADLESAAASVGGSQGRVRVPLPADRRPTDWERTTAGLESARWITADMSYRREALAAVGGFDERFPRAFREDADLALRVRDAGWELVRGTRAVTHPVRPADPWVSVRQQAGNADDFLMRRVHGADWRRRAGAPAGRRARHTATVAAAVAGVGALAAGRRRAAGAAWFLWLAGTVELAVARIAPGPRDRAEVRRMVLTSTAIPFAAVRHSVTGAWRHRLAGPWRGVPDVVLFDRDGTLVHDVPYNADPQRVEPVAGARESLDRLRAAGVRVGIVTNQSGVGRGRITPAELDAVHDRLEELLGPLDVWRHCPHLAEEGCACRKPAPGMVTDACRAIGAAADRCVVVGDIGADVEAARAAGAVGILVPTSATRLDEVRDAPRVAASVTEAVDDVLGGRW
jgi:HAD superfamily hydrolase (TIGR01662 family)